MPHLSSGPVTGRARSATVGLALLSLLVSLGLSLGLPTGGASAASSASSAAATGRTFYVSTGGNDRNAGSAAAPWRTLSTSMEKLRPGDTLLVANGSYWEKDGIRPDLPAGRPDARITVRPWGQGTGDRVILTIRMHLVDAAYWTFDGLNIDARPAGNTSGSPAALAPSSALLLRGGIGWEFRNAEICCYPAYGVVTIDGPARNWTFSHNFVWGNWTSDNTDRFHLMYVTTNAGSGPGYIERNVLAGALDGTNIKLGRGTYDARLGDPTGVTIQRNTMVGANWNVRLVYGTAGTVIERNILTGADKPWPTEATAIQAYCLSGGSNYSSANLWYGPQTRRVLDPVNRGLNCAAGTRGWVREASASRGPVDPQLAVTPAQTYRGTFGGLRVSQFVPRNAAAADYGRFSGFDQVLAGDWNGDGVATPAGVLRNRIYLTDQPADPASWQYGEAEQTFSYGRVGDTLLVGDWNGDGHDEIGAFNPATSTFSLSGQPAFKFGSNKVRYTPVAGDWDGDGREEVALYDLAAKTFHLRHSSASVTSFAFGSRSQTYRPVAGDWDGDGRDDVAIWQPSLRTFHVRPCAAATCAEPVRSIVAGSGAYATAYQPVAGRWGTSRGDSLGIVLRGQWFRMQQPVAASPFLSVRSYDG
ncbi:FG-GAP repeat domain-containing protein [Nocardioides alkalitolerans]|uniref:FG-GAP repeat domain-containing protein n=1 Tax=Nocardioides alkalitolerans TaxID=281714 RepID=UPI0004149A84|nr:VCBS repeat-containing protein [Nocardioides alkalitolerans]